MDEQERIRRVERARALWVHVVRGFYPTSKPAWGACPVCRGRGSDREAAGMPEPWVCSLCNGFKEHPGLRMADGAVGPSVGWSAWRLLRDGPSFVQSPKFSAPN